MWTAKQSNWAGTPEYAKLAASRLSQMKVSLRELDEFREKQKEFFLKWAESS
ncbi:hypothetical protein [Paenibacillus sp. NPDC055715]